MNINSIQNNNNDIELRQQAAEFVNKIFYGTMLQQMRQASDEPFFGKAPGMDIFQSKLDNELIHRLSQNGKGPLVDAVVKQLKGNKAQAVELKATGQNYYQANLANVYRGIDG